MNKTPKKVPRSIWGFVIFTAREIIAKRKWALLPLWILLAAIGVLILVGGGSSLLPAIYVAF